MYITHLKQIYMEKFFVLNFCPGLYESQEIVLKKDETKELWKRIKQLIIDQKSFSISSSNEEITKFIDEQPPIYFKFQIAKTIHKKEEDVNISHEEFIKMLETDETDQAKEKKNDPDEIGWDLDLIMFFDEHVVEKAHAIGPNIMQEFKDVEDYWIDVFILMNTTLREIRKTLISLDVEMHDF